MRRLLAAIAAVALIILLPALQPARAAGYTLTEIDIPQDSSYYPTPPDVTAKNVIIVDNATCTVLYSKGNINKKIYPASTTKILTALLVAENISDLQNTIITVSNRAVNLSDGSSTAGLKAGDKVSALDLLYGLMLPSGNDAAIALAEYIGSSVAGFASMMNERATELGATGTNFVNPHGLSNDNHYSTSHDMAIFAHALTQHEVLNKIVKTVTYKMTVNRNGRNVTYEINNTNDLLYPEKDSYNRYITGLKTGSTSAAGYCLVARYQKGDTDLLVLSFDSESSARFTDTNTLINYAASGFSTINLSDVFSARDFVVKVNNATESDEGGGMLALRFTEVRDYVMVTTTTLAQAIKNAGEQSGPVRVEKPESIDAPVYAGDVVGNVTIYLNDEILLQGNVVATREVLQHFDLPADLIALKLDTGNSQQKTLLQQPSFWIILFGAPISLFILYFIARLMLYRRHARARAQRNQVYTRHSEAPSGIGKYSSR